MKSLRLLGFAGGAAVLCFAQMAASSHASNLPNAEFRTGTDTPNGWVLSGGKGAWVDRELLSVHGTGTDSNYWRSDFEFTPGGLYRFAMRVRQRQGSGSVIAGPVFANRDYSVSPQWKWYSHVFRVPDNVGASYVRLGQWQATGTIEFDAVRLVPVLPVHQLHESGVLGEGEAIRDGRYLFSGNYLHEGSNYHRVLERTSTSFNSNRWTFGDAAEVVYRFGDLGGQLESGSVSVNVNYYIRGQCVTEVSRDGTTWETVMKQTGLGRKTAPLPSAVLPATDLRLRLRGAGGCSLQVDGVELSAAISNMEDGVGRTEYAEVLQKNPDLMVERLTIRKGSAKGSAALLTVRTTRPGEVNGQLTGSMTTSDGKTVNLPSARALVDQEACVLEVPLVPVLAGSNRVDLTLATPDQSPLLIRFSLGVPDFYRSDYGARIAELGQQACVWWCDATRKIPRERATPQKTTAAASFSAARNDYEAVQVVVCPKEELRSFTAEASALIGPSGAKIDAKEINVLRVAYHYVHTPTDATGVRDDWPDALPPLDEPLDLPGGLNQPLWVLTYVPPGTSPGDYRGHLTLKAEGYTQRIPLHLHVWDFELPRKNHLQTAFGLSAGNIFRYHQAKTDAEKRRVWDLYMKCFAEHRISPYNPTPLDPIGVKFLPDQDPPRAELDFSSFDAAMDRAVERFNVTGLRLGVQGMGGGTFHDRYEPSIEGFGEQTPQYKAMFSSYVSQLEEHLKQRGWLDLVYVYWFDEPAPQDYEFVRRGMQRLKRLAPGLTTMLTEQPEEALAGPVDIWSPVSNNYDHEAAKPFRANGDRFWWYVCTGPKAPYCTLFIDHPATELRVWLWQTWKRDISGILVWSSNYWTSTAAFPDPAQPQNPYADPMGYVSGYSTPKGTKRHWGNGDGRFVYPPLSAALPGASGPGAVIASPVSSLRWEMLREGIEDYEYLSILRQRLRRRGDQLPESVRAEYESLLSVPETITKDMTTFTKDASPIYQHRAAVARAIERLIQPE